MALRMLLWPHKDIPDADFIDAGAGPRLVEAAIARLQTFAFAAILEDSLFASDLQAWLGRPFALDRMNETAGLPATLSAQIDQELTQEAFGLLDARSTLDRQIWLFLERQQGGAVDAGILAEQAFVRSVARHAALARSFH